MEGSKVLLVTSTVGCNEIYFKDTQEYLKKAGIYSRIIIPEDWNLDKLETQLEAELKDRTYSIVGWSYGGLPAFEVAHKSPKKIDKLVLVETVLDWKDHPLKFKFLAGFLSSLPDQMKANLASKESVIRRLLNELLGSEIDKTLYEELVDVTAKHGGRWLANATLDGKRYMKGKNNLARLTTLPDTIKVFYIYGENSKFTKGYPRKIWGQGAGIYGIKDCGHIVSLENPDEFNEVLADILLD